MNIDKELQLIRKKHSDLMRAELTAAEVRYYADKFPHADVKSVGVETTVDSTVYVVNDFRLTFNSDRYNNCNYKLNKLPPVEVVEVFADRINRLERTSQHPYKSRRLQALYMHIAGYHHKELSAEEMFKLYEQACGLPVESNNRERSGFHAWLLTRSYCCDDSGHLGQSLRNWEHRNAFIDLLIKNGCTLPSVSKSYLPKENNEPVPTEKYAVLKLRDSRKKWQNTGEINE